MGDYKVKWSTQAENDLDEIMWYFAKKALVPIVGERLVAKLRKAGNSLSFAPYGPFYNKKWGVRKDVVGNYLIFYTTDEEERTVMITQVVYGRRNLRKVFRRPPK
jgi:plasmid stabilization system protein ParE